MTTLRWRFLTLYTHLKERKVFYSLRLVTLGPFMWMLSFPGGIFHWYLFGKYFTGLLALLPMTC